MRFLSSLLLASVLVSGCIKKTSNTQPDSKPIYPPTMGANFGKDFVWGIATAPAHVEDQLNDVWLDFAKSGHVAAWKNAPLPEERLQFWSNPDPEIDLAAATGAKVFRMGVDWGRLVPHLPGSNECGISPCSAGVQDTKALQNYLEIVKKVRAKGMRVMMTLFHHSPPLWAQKNDGWLNPDIVPQFVAFSEDVVRTFAPYVDEWVTFNEPASFILLAYIGGMWPPAIFNPKGLLAGLGYSGSFHRGVRNMTNAHNILFQSIHKLDTVTADSGSPEAAPAKVGIAHNVSFHVANTIFDQVQRTTMRNLLNFMFVDQVADSLDFLGVNYYGAEYISGISLEISDRLEYSDSGRAIEPFGFYSLLKELHQRYNIQLQGRKRTQSPPKPIPFIITENGISDDSDLLRPAYLIEHLVAISAAMQEGVPVKGYIFWTVSDNWEWADGYCPKFGLVSVDRQNGLARKLRPSFDLFKTIVTTSKVTPEQRSASWELVRKNIGKERPFCRAPDGKSSLDIPVMRKIVDRDWRFTGARLK